KRDWSSDVCSSDLQELIVNVRGMEKFAYEIENNTVTAQVEKAEKQKVDAKVVLRGEPKEEVVGVEVLDDVIAQYNDDIGENIKEAKIIVDVDGLEGEERSEERRVGKECRYRW